MRTNQDTKDIIPVSDPTEREKLTQEQVQAILELAGRRKNDPTLTAWMDEVDEYREQVRREEADRNEAATEK
ncbi:MAG: hypothetical protein OHK0029_37390 [Armatimonadaceae bacterium]